jgi:hypothetical protein
MDPNFKDSVKVGAQEGLLRVAQSLQSLPKWQRITIIVVIIGIIPGFFIAKYGSYFAAKAYYKKYAVTARPSFSNPQAAQSSAVSVLAIGGGEYAAYAKITNPNFELSSPGGQYEMTFVNAKNEQVATTSGTFFLLPGQSKYVVASRIKSSEKITSGKITLSGVSWQKRDDAPTIKLRSTDPHGENQTNPQAYVVSGEVANDSPYTLKRVRIILLLHDSSDRIVAVSSRDEFDVTPRSRRAYQQTWPGVFSSQVSRIEVQAETNTLDDVNLKVEPVNTNSGGGLDRPDVKR